MPDNDPAGGVRSARRADRTDAADHQTAVTSQGPRSKGWQPLAAGLFTAVVGFLASWHPSLWTDEAATISAAQRSVSELWQMVQNLDLVHGFYYLLMHAWIDVFGTSAVSLRLPSALLTGVAGACVFVLGDRLSGRSLACTATVVFAVLPRISWAGLEARPFALTVACATGATALLLVAVDRPGRSRLLWVGYAVVLLLGVLGNLYVGLLIGAHLLIVLLDRRVDRAVRTRWLVAAGATIVASAPFLLAAYRQKGQLSDRPLSLVSLLQNVVVNQWFLGDTPTSTTGVNRTNLQLSDVGSWWQAAAIALAALGWVLMIVAVVHALRSASDSPQRRLMIWTVPWLVLPTAVIGVYSLLVSPMYTPRYLTFAAPAVALLMAAGLATLRKSAVRVTALALIVLCAVPVYVSQRQLYGKNSSDWISVAAYVEQHAGPGDAVYFAPRYDVPGPTVGQTTRGIQVAYPAAFTGLRDVTLLTTPADAADLVGVSQRLPDSADRLVDVDTLIVVERNDYDADLRAADEAFLTASGFVPTDTWTGSLDTVVVYRRTG